MTSELLPLPYRCIHLLPEDWHGWFFNAESIHRLVAGQTVRCVVELGSWLGLSTRFFAELVGDQGTVYAVDTWLGSQEMVGLPECESRLDRLYQQFLSNMVHAGLAHRVVPIRMSTMEAARALNLQPDLVYVDASHAEEDVYNDVLHWYGKLADGGRMCGDDWHWPSVQAGVVRAAEQLGRPVHGSDTFWWLE